MSESDLQSACNAILRERDLMYYHIEKGRHHKQRTRRAGIPDLIIWPGNGYCFAVELKTKEGTMNKDQIEWMQKWQDKGYKYYIVRSVEQFENVLKLEAE